MEQLKQLPHFAQFILDKKLEAFSLYQLELSYEMDLPVLRSLADLSKEQLLASAIHSNREMLEFLKNNDAKSHVRLSIERWINNELIVNKHAIKTEDIHQIVYIRKLAFLHFLPEYSRQEKFLEIIKEIDLYCMHLTMETGQAYLQLFQENLDANSHLIQKVNETFPGAVYVFNLSSHQTVFSNKKLGDFIGNGSWDQGREELIRELVHPEDQKVVREKIEELHQATDQDIISYKYRVKDGKGEYRWVRNYESVFKRNERDEVVETIGIILDVDKEHRAAQALKENENLYKRAEAITHLGSFSWELSTNHLKWSDELYRIYGLDPEKDELTFDYIGSFNVSEDTPDVRASYQKAIIEKKPVDFYYRIQDRYGKFKILHARGEMVLNNEGTVTHMIGTVQDVTEKQTLIRKLEHNESVHRQAEELTNMGSWTWNLKTNKIEWSDQMYKIYELEEPVEKDVFKEFVHPEDRQKTEQILQSLLNEKYSDHEFRILTKTGKVKKLHTIARVHLDKLGQPEYIIGAEQDITEKENLLEKLRTSQELYRQAEELANMGNWTWDLASGQLEWTDHLYRMYGLEPQSEKLTIERFYELVHPDDRQLVKKELENLDEKLILDFSFKIIRANGQTRIMRMAAQVQKDKAGKAFRIIGTERDITEKQNLIDQLKKSESLYKQAQMLTHVGNWGWDIASGKIEWSDELYRIYGLEPQSIELNFETYLDFIHPDDRAKVKSQVDHANQTGNSWEFNHRIIRQTGEIRILQASGEVLKDEQGNTYMMIGTAQDVTERQSLIEKLQENEKFFKQAQSLARMGSWTMDVKTKDFTWSDEMYNIFEIDKSTEFDFEKWLQHIPENERKATLDYYEECLHQKRTYDRIHQIILHNGKIKTVHRKGEFMLDEYGEPVKMIGTTQDITEEHRIQQELKENQTFIRKITDATPSIIASYNINTGQYVFISEGLQKLLGYSTEEVMQKGVAFFTEIIHPDDMHLVMSRNAQAVEEANADPEKNDLVVEFTYRIRHLNGEYRWFHTYGTIFDRNKDGKVEHVLNISLDISEQIHATQTIKEQEHFIQQIADASPTILYLYDIPQQSIVYINREIFFVLGYAPDEITEMKQNVTSELYHPEDLDLLPARRESQKNFQQVDSMIQYECRMKNKQGEWRWLLVREIVFKTDEQGNITQILGAALDINKRKEMEKTILQNTLLLEQSNASLEEFAYVASHDLKEPLRKISTFGDRLAASQSEHITPEGKLYLQKIIDASHRMQTMINDLLSISMITGNTAFEQYSLQKILDETLQTLEFKTEQLGAVIKADPLPDAYIIPFQFRQLFQNLLSNSLKFIRPDVQPQITISYKMVKEEDMHHYGLSKATHYHKIVFSDNGIGFDNEYAAKIFAIFQRLHGRSEYEGSGIGLAICKKIVEHHGGVIYAEGVEGQGASFTIILPA